MRLSVVEGHRDGSDVGGREHRTHRRRERSRLAGRPDRHRATGPKPGRTLAQERLAVDLRVGVVQQEAWSVVDVEEHDVIRAAGLLCDDAADVANHDVKARVVEQATVSPRALTSGRRNDAAAVPPHEVGLDLDDDDPLDARIVEKRGDREAEPEPTD